MKKIEAYLRPAVIGEVIAALHGIGIEGLSLMEIKGCGKQKGHIEHYRGAEYTINLLPKVKLELFVKDAMARAAVETIRRAAYTGEIGDGKIFISEIAEALRIRTEETGEAAV